MAPPRVVDDFDTDDLADEYEADGYGDDQDLSAEDQAAMGHGTSEVKKVLGPDARKVTTRQIQDALWDFYYDVDKAVSYLRKTFIPPASVSKPAPAPKKTAEGMSNAISLPTPLSSLPRQSGESFGAGPDWSELVGCTRNARSISSCASPALVPHGQGVPSPTEFSDMPWLQVPSHRRTVFIAPTPPRGGLLGGSDGASKISKLQALAAARKKKNDEKKDKDGPNAAAQFQKLSITESDRVANAEPVSGVSKRQKTSVKTSWQPRDATSSSRLEHKLSSPGPPQQRHPVGLDGSWSPDVLGVPADLEQAPQDGGGELGVASAMAHPSAFARTLFGSAPEIPTAQRPAVYAMPYTASPSFLASAFSKSSPDDVVLAAQAKAGKKTSMAAKNTKVKTDKQGGSAAQDSEILNGLSNLAMNDIPAPRSKGIDVVKEFENSNAKRSVSFVVVGHVDAGKSTLMGRLLLDLKFVEDRTVEKYRKAAEKSGKQSFALAWVMDQRSEERDRGVTIDIATNHFETATTKFTILDAPGHRDFVPNMIAGASQADFAVLVIDANTGAYEKGLKGQTREHVLLLRSLGVQRLVVAINKLDMVNWSQQRFEEISQEVTGFLTGLGFQRKYISILPISGLSGVNITEKIRDPAASWYTGPTLIEALESSGPVTVRALKKPFRMGISEVFRSQQGTTTLAGRIDAGTTQVGDVVFVQPSGETAFIKSIMVDNASQNWAVAGQNITVALTDIESIHIRVGDIICDTTDPVKCGNTFVMKAMAFEHLMPMPVDLHRGRLHAAGQIQSIFATLDKSTGEVIKKKPKIVQPGAVARVKITLNSKVPLEAGQRVVVRSQGETIAAGLLE